MLKETKSPQLPCCPYLHYVVFGYESIPRAFESLDSVFNNFKICLVPKTKQVWTKV
jgi:hypothetical protein